MIAPLIAFALVAFSPAQKLMVNVNAKDGDVISGERKFVVSVQSKNPVTQVEFYVGNELRDTDTSTPYEFKLDTLGENDGDVKVKFAAYSSEGENASKTLALKVDNGIAKRAAFHITAAREALTLSKWDDAINAGRIAVKADPKSAEAKVLLSRGYMGKGVWDKAQKYAEDAVTADANNLEALELVAAINLNKAFRTINRGTDVAETNKAIADALQKAVMARRKSLDSQVDKFGGVTDANRMAYVDLAMRAGRYSLAIDQLAPLFRKDPKNNDVADRLVYAYLRTSRMNDAREALDNIRRYGAFDAYGNALDAVYQVEVGNSQKADDALREAILSDPDSLGVKSAQAYIALKRGRSNVLQQLAKDLSSTDSQRTEVNYYVSALANRIQDFPSAAKYFERAVLAEPTNYDMYIEAANQTLGRAVNGRMDKKDADAGVAFAKALYESALLANPSSAQALVGITLTSLYQGKKDDAMRYGKAAVLAAPQYPAAHYAYSAALTAGAGAAGDQSVIKRLSDEAYKENQMAGKLDAVNLGGREMPKVQQAWIYFANGGRTVVLVPPGR